MAKVSFRMASAWRGPPSTPRLPAVPPCADSAADEDQSPDGHEDAETNERVDLVGPSAEIGQPKREQRADEQQHHRSPDRGQHGASRTRIWPGRAAGAG